MTSILDRLQQRGEETQTLEHIAARLSHIEAYHSQLVNYAQNQARCRAVEELYVPLLPQTTATFDWGMLPQFAAATTTYSAELTHQTLNTFEVETIVVLTGKKVYLQLGNRFFYINPANNFFQLVKLRLPLQQSDKRIVISQTAATDVFVGLYGTQQGDAYSVS